ncbi:hypothetical protein PGT21_008272 [Puccinia graminis f. sp. tritici]|uniref:Uncharacterized protein n=1 Tax=Puccinia graminis f. sp. tritici TaxID=56615 RepID=A0A5B0M1Z7_PUCGR|nr:hypothetical protein PGT21_008272 [Puccinia graminis f. sp. tritici]
MLSNRSCRRSRKPLVVFQAAIELSPRGDGAGETRDHLRRDPPIFLWGAFPAVEGCGPGLNTRPAIDPPPWTKLIEPLCAAFLMCDFSSSSSGFLSRSVSVGILDRYDDANIFWKNPSNWPLKDIQA